MKLSKFIQILINPDSHSFYPLLSYAILSFVYLCACVISLGTFMLIIYGVLFVLEAHTSREFPSEPPRLRVRVTPFVHSM